MQILMLCIIMHSVKDPSKGGRGSC